MLLQFVKLNALFYQHLNEKKYIHTFSKQLGYKIHVMQMFTCTCTMLCISFDSALWRWELGFNCCCVLR